MSDAFDIEVAHDGQEAFEYLMNHPVDVVFTDIRMPIMDGLALSDKIRKLYPEICILIITGIMIIPMPKAPSKPAFLTTF